jgi:lycopene cyclase domain-containing protein
VGLYFWLDLLIIAFPVALSFDRKVRFVRRWPAALGAAGLVAVPYLAWDSLMSFQGAWGFSDRYAGTFRLFGLPPGEFVFFLAVPFACLFVHEVVRAYVPEKAARTTRLPWAAVAVICAAAAFLVRGRLYTSTVLAAVALFFAVAAALAPGSLSRRTFWLSILVSYVPFLVANGLLTALPVVTYGEGHFLGFRVVTIPVEDFLYSFSLLGFNLLAYRLFRGAESSSPTAQARDAAPLPRDGTHHAGQH